MYTDEWTTINDVRLHWQDWGDKGAPVLLMLHGLTQQSHTFDAVAERFAGRYRCIALDVRGRGESGWAPPETYALPQYVADLVAFLDRCEIAAAHVLGTSMGGLCGLSLGAVAPGRLASLALNDIGPVIDPAGSARIAAYTATVPESFESFVYLSQVQQAAAIKTAVEYWRSRRPLCMGALYWQLNDNWPVCSWSSIDYSGSWKLLHYAARRFFAPLLLCAWVKDGRVEVALVNDLASEAHAQATVSVVGFDGAAVRKETIDARVAARSAQRLMSRAVTELAAKPEEVFLHLALEGDGGTSYNELFLAEPKRSPLAKARVTIETEQGKNGISLVLSTDAPVFYAALDAGGVSGEFSDNGFTLMPGVPRGVRFHSRQRPPSDRPPTFTVRHLRETYR